MPITHTRNYQTEGIHWLTEPNVLDHNLDRTLCRHLLADDPGAGKTYQASEASHILSSSVLALCPAHLCRQWYEYWQDQYPDEVVVWLEGNSASKQRDALVAANCYIASIQSLRQPYVLDLLIQVIHRNHIQCVIVDESHYVKNRDALQAKAVAKLTSPKLVPHAILLTATPIQREADDLYHQLHILDPLFHHSFYQWLQKYCWCTLTAWGPQDVTLKRTADLSQWLMGRTYAQIGLELPPVIPSVHTCQLTTVRRKAYNDVKDYWYSEIAAGVSLSVSSSMEMMHLLRRITNGPEKQALLTSYSTDDPKPILIGAAYRQTVKELSQALHSHDSHIRVTQITGDVPAHDRVALAKQPTDFIVATIPALSEGCDLSHCYSVYFYEEDWAPGRHHQFLSRVQRHNPIDNHPVILRYFHADKTIDQRIHAVRDSRSVDIRTIAKQELGV